MMLQKTCQSKRHQRWPIDIFDLRQRLSYEDRRNGEAEPFHGLIKLRSAHDHRDDLVRRILVLATDNKRIVISTRHIDEFECIRIEAPGSSNSETDRACAKSQQKVYQK